MEKKLRSWLSLSDPSPVDSVSADPGVLYGSNTSEELQHKLELRDIFRDEQLFKQYLPRSVSAKERFLQAGPIRTWVDHWSPDSQFIPMDSSRVFFSSAMSGLLVSAIATPFDVVKNYWIFSPQFRGSRNTVTSREVVRSLYDKGGIRSFYTGFGATCCAMIPANLIFFWSYEHYRFEGPPAIAGVKARTLAVVLTMPAEYVRTRLQANVGETSFLEIYRTISGLEGIRSYTKGVVVTMLRDAPFSAIYWTLNEKFKIQLAAWDKEYQKDKTSFRSKFMYPFISGASAAAVASIMTQPFDVVKTNIQGVDNLFKRRGAYYKPHNGMLSVAGQIYTSQGYKGFFVGLIPRLAKIVPSCAVLLATYDFSKAMLTSEPENYDFESF